MCIMEGGHGYRIACGGHECGGSGSGSGKIISALFFPETLDVVQDFFLLEVILSSALCRRSLSGLGTEC